MILIFICIINTSLYGSYQPYYQPIQIQQNQIQYYYPQQHYYRQRVVNYTTIMHVHAQQRQTTLYNCYPGQQQIQNNARVRPRITQATHVRPSTSQNLHNAIPVTALPFNEESSRIETGQADNRRNQLAVEINSQEEPPSQQNAQNIMRCLLSCCCHRS